MILGSCRKIREDNFRHWGRVGVPPLSHSVIPSFTAQRLVSNGRSSAQTEQCLGNGVVWTAGAIGPTAFPPQFRRREKCLDHMFLVFLPRPSYPVAMLVAIDAYMRAMCFRVDLDRAATAWTVFYPYHQSGSPRSSGSSSTSNSVPHSGQRTVTSPDSLHASRHTPPDCS